MSTKGKYKAKFSINGAGVLSAKSAELFKSDKGKLQIKALKKIHDNRKSRGQIHQNLKAAG